MTQALRALLGTRAHVFLLGVSGSGGMEAALVNVLSAGDAVLIVENGQFGERFSSIAEGLPVALDRLVIPWGEAPDPEQIAARVKAKQYRAVVVIHNESATGVVADLAGIGAVLRDTETLLVVDSVSGVGGVDFRMDEWGVDVVVTASQKSLMCPPGLAIAASEREGDAGGRCGARHPALLLRFPPRQIFARQGRDAVHAAGLADPRACARRSR